MTTSSLKPFQRATVDHVLTQFRRPGGSRRFLVADEVGLGKTLVAQGIIDGLCTPDRTLNVFYVCSSLSIARQNRDNLLEMLPKAERKYARVEVDRLTLLPSMSPSRDTALRLYTLTPNTLPVRSQLGRVDERAVLSVLLRRCLDLRRNAALINELQGPVSDGTWASEQNSAERALEDVTRTFLTAFKRNLCVQLGLSESAWYSSVEQELRDRLRASRGKAVQMLRIALSLTALDNLSPDLVIFDEFQRFFELLSLADDDEMLGEDVDRDGRGLLKALLSGRTGDGGGGPAVLLLSATPYRLYGDLASGAPTAHHREFFTLLQFLFGKNGKQKRDRIEREFELYGQLLQRARIDSNEVFEVRDRIQEQLTSVIARTERSDFTGPYQEFKPDERRFIPSADDFAMFKHLLDSARPEHRAFVQPYWASIPYPLQSMDRRGYVLRRDAEVAKVPAAVKAHSVVWDRVRRFQPVGHGHPRLRMLLEDAPPELLSLPWLPPTAPWWPLGSRFEQVNRRAVERGDASATKVLMFSRFRAVPRAVASVLSYEAERAAFGRDHQRSRGGRSDMTYDYTARSRSHGSGEAGAALVGVSQPRPAFVFNVSKSEESGLPTLLDFFPLPALAALGDPLVHLERGSEPTLRATIAAVRTSLERELGRSSSSGQRRPLWRWVRMLEKRSPEFEAMKAGWTRYIEARGDGPTEKIARFFLEQDSEPGRPPNATELDELAHIALLSPAAVLLRATNRVFGNTADGAARIHRVLEVSVDALRGYLDTPEFHLLQSGRTRRDAVRKAIWDGNFESVLDEYLTVLLGLGEKGVPEGREERAFEHLSTALRLRTSSIELAALTRSAQPFKLRCHAALPLGLNPSEVVTDRGELRSDFLRIAFNSPFRPFVLATTSIGQEGLDFHTYCSRLVHWDLPSNPVDLEQRDGRIRRFGGLAVRRAMALSPRTFKAGQSPWRAATSGMIEEAGGLIPWWIHPQADVRRSVYLSWFSETEDQLQHVLNSVALYRMTLGQPDQAQLAKALRRRLEEAGTEREELVQWLKRATLCLSPYFLQTRPAPDDTRRTGA